MNNQINSDLKNSLQHGLQNAFLVFLVVFVFLLIAASMVYIDQYMPVFNLPQINVTVAIFTTALLGLSAYILILTSRIKYLTNARDIDKHSSLHDALTGAANRRHFTERLDELLEDKSPSHTLLMIDLDRFKPINDLYGHAAGDALLRELTIGFKRLVKNSDLVARLGGDEFAILIRDSDREEVRNTAIAILQYVNKYKMNWEGQRLGVGASIGVVHIDRPGLEATKVMAGSDEALYTAKETGRGTIFVAESLDKSNTFNQFTQIDGDVCPPSYSARSHEPEDGQTLMLFAQQMASLEVTERNERRRLHGSRRRNEIAHWIYIEPVTQGDQIRSGIQMRELISDAAEHSDGGADFSRWIMAMCISAASRLSPGVVGRTQFVIPLPAKSLVTVPGLVEELMRSNALARQPLRHMTFVLHDIPKVYDSPVLKQALERLKASDVNLGFELRAESVEALAPLRHIAFSEIHLGPEIIKKLRPGTSESATLDALIAIGESFSATLVAPGVNSQEELRLLSEKGVKRYAGPVRGKIQQIHAELEELPHRVEYLQHGYLR